ncbi:tyrosine-type recombinase/integrase [Acholeplasma laidlawii]|uniref:tyrosine-type recombinase/integrase n=1 Tax=Acholeplasma laidlawii TaxID=2148 RepID=UPI0021F7BBCC|nr:tyrosine-type recombinase/integrase [Acholeplasma laidlawii]
MQERDLKSIIDEYIDYMDRKQITKDSYKRILYKYYDYITTLTISNPKRNDVLKYKEYLLKNLGSASVQKHIVVLRGFYRYCKLNNYYDDITYEVRGMKIQPTFKRQALSIEDSKRLLQKAKQRAKDVLGKRNYAIVALLLTTGLRSIEIERSDVYDLDIIDGSNVLFIMGKGRDSKDAFVKISNEVYEIIQDYLITRNDSNEALFLTHNNKNKSKRLSTKVIRSAVKELLISIGYDSKAYSVHSLRHTFATTALIEGASLLETKEALRHSDVSTTQIYAHLVEKLKSNTYQKVSDALFK